MGGADAKTKAFLGTKLAAVAAAVAKLSKALEGTEGAVAPLLAESVANARSVLAKLQAEARKGEEVDGPPADGHSAMARAACGGGSPGMPGFGFGM